MDFEMKKELNKNVNCQAAVRHMLIATISMTSVVWCVGCREVLSVALCRCRDDYYELFAPRCGGCGHPISEQFITALSQQWHTHCFVCAVSNLASVLCLWSV